MDAGYSATDQMDQNYSILVIDHANFPSKKCSSENVNDSVQISNPQLLLSIKEILEAILQSDFLQPYLY